MSAAPPAVELRAAAKRYGEAVALHPTDLTCPAGAVTALLGSSGCGKSTVLRLILGLLWPTAGEIRVGGEPVTPATVQALRHRTGYVVQDGGLFPHLTAFGNVALLPNHLGRDQSRTRARAAELAELVRLPSSLLDRYPAELSGGQRQRVGLMRALALDPPLLLMDEPMGALDPLVRAELQADLRELFRALGKTVVLVTHDLREAELLADGVTLLHEGRVVQTGAMRELRETPATPFVTRFLSAFEGPA